MIVCDKCGHENSDGRRFCEACDEYLVWRGKSVSATMVSLAPTQVTVAAGSEASAKVRVYNRGTIVDKFTVEVSAELDGWTTVEPAALNIYASRNEEATLRFHPPRSPEVPAGQRPFTVTVRSEVDPETTAQATGTVTVDPFTDLDARLVPTTSRSTTVGEHEIKIGNAGNAPADVTIVASNPDEQLAFQLDPEKLTLPPGGGATVTLRVAPSGSAEPVPGVPQPFRVTLSTGEAAPMVLDGAYQRLTLVQLEGTLDPTDSRTVGTAEHWVTVTNQGNSPATPTITATDANGVLSFQITPSTLTLEPGAGGKARIWVAPRPNAEVREGPDGSRDQALPFRIAVQAGDSPPLELNGTYTPLFVNLEAGLEPKTSRSVDVGQHGLSIVNRGNRPAVVEITATDPDETLSVRVSPNQLTVDPGQTAHLVVRVSLRDPRGDGRADPRPFEVQVKTQGSEPLRLAGAYVPLFGKLEGSLDPVSSQGVGPGEHWLVLKNTGNLALDASVAAVDPTNLFVFAVDPAWAHLEPDASARLRVGITPRKKPKGTPAPQPFQVQVASNAAPPLVIQGSRVQMPPEPGRSRAWLIRLLVAIAIAVVAIVIALLTTANLLIVNTGTTSIRIPIVSLVVLLLGLIGFLIFTPRRGWVLAVGLLVAAAVALLLLATQPLPNF